MAISQESEQQGPRGLIISTTYLYTPQKLFYLKQYRGFVMVSILKNKNTQVVVIIPPELKK